MARQWIRWIGRTAIAAAVVAALAVPVVFPERVKAIATVIATRIQALSSVSVIAIVVEIIVGGAALEQGADAKRNCVEPMLRSHWLCLL